MAAFVAGAGPCTLVQRRQGGWFAALARAIVYQWARIHRLDGPPAAAQLADLGERYRPWRTVAAWYCWRAMESRVSSSPAGW